MNDYNFFKQYEEQVVKKSKINFPALPVIVLLLVAGVLAFLEWEVMTQTKMLTVRLQEIEIEKSATLGLQNDVKIATEEFSKTSNFYKTVEELNRLLAIQDFISTKQFDDISLVLPSENTHILAMVIDSSTITFGGIADDRSKIAEFQHNLKGLDYINDVFVSSVVKQTGSNDFEFNMICQLKKEVAVNEAE